MAKPRTDGPGADRAFFPLDKTARVRRVAGIASRRIADEVVIIPVRTNPDQELGVYSLNHTAAAAWELLDGQRTLAAVGSLIREQFEETGDDVEADLRSLCQDLLEAGLLERLPD